jgi:flagellar biosynthesis chaperone FliJ
VNKYNTSSNNNTEFSYSTNNQNNNNQNFSDSINRSLDQTKDNINRSIEESRNQIPHYNTIVNSYQEQALQTVKEISENYIESQKSIIHSLQSAWGPYQQNLNNKVNTCMSPEAVANAYSRFVSTVADNTVTALRTTNNMVFSNLDSWKSTLQQAKDNSKQIFNLNSKTAKTFEQNAREVARASQDAAPQNNVSYNSRGGGGDNASTSFTTSTPAGTTSTTTTSKSTA